MTATILVVDDEPDLEALVLQKFRKQINDGMVSFIFAQDGIEALASIEQHQHVDMVVSDLNMPRMDGREALGEIKGDPELRQIPVVILTTSKADEDIVASYDLGVNSFITKPVTFAALVEVLRTWSRYWFEIVDLPGGRG